SVIRSAPEAVRAILHSPLHWTHRQRPGEVPIRQDFWPQVPDPDAAAVVVRRARAVVAELRVDSREVTVSVGTTSTAAGVPRLGVIAAAGRGRRIHPRSATVHKVLLEVDGQSLLARNLELVRDALGIREFLIIVGHLGSQIREAFGDGTAFG